MWEIKFFNGVPVNNSDQYVMLVSSEGELGWSTDLQFATRALLKPLYEGMKYPTASIPFIITPGPNVTDISTWAQSVRLLFGRDLEVRTLTVLNDGVFYYIDAYLQSLSISGGRGLENYFTGTLVLSETTGTSTLEETDNSSPLVVSGNAPAKPAITISPVTTDMWYVTAIVTDTLGVGVQNHPMVITFDSSIGNATASANYDVYCNGIRVPFRCYSPDTSSTKIWVIVNIRPGSITSFSIYFSNLISNPLADTLDQGGLDMQNSTNSLFIWNSFTISKFPERSGSWRPAKSGVQGSTFYGISGEANSSVRFNVSGSNQPLLNDYDSMLLTLSGVRAASSNALTNLVRTYFSTSALSYVRYRVLYESSWYSAWSATVGSPTSASTALNVPQAVQIVVGIEWAGVDLTAIAYNQVSGAGSGGTFQLALTDVPSIGVTAVQAGKILTGVLSLDTGEYVSFNTVYVIGNLILDIASERIYTSTNIVPVSPTGGIGIVYSSPKGLTLYPGIRTWTNAPNTAATFTWRPRLALV